jgi:hypothetical protein
MANNIIKYIDVTGDAMSLKVIYLACALSYSEKKKSEEAQCTSLARALRYMNCDDNSANRHGWAEIIGYSKEIEMVTAEPSKVTIDTLTPYGNLSEVMEELRAKFPKCEFHCYNSIEEENEFD